MVSIGAPAICFLGFESGVIGMGPMGGVTAEERFFGEARERFIAGRERARSEPNPDAEASCVEALMGARVGVGKEATNFFAIRRAFLDGDGGGEGSSASSSASASPASYTPLVSPAASGCTNTGSASVSSK